eukprot:gnl/TRDRNA2_/TRDRNA2_164273_c0_seq3.p1 gnl/TRDRNA2_/TRDRNA2_164273_c0~~gnl/TRDRNA2_/TRDRNA2_164273_c0_seq3.p1  ORF type:complete len:221 (-),score=50.90 gnl/TRDRNA2_/TRDRNA2_164273_c0_seq3:13-642(-)
MSAEKQARQLGHAPRAAPSKGDPATESPDMLPDMAAPSDGNTGSTSIKRDDGTESEHADAETRRCGKVCDVEARAATVVTEGPKVSRKAKQRARLERQKSRQQAWEAAEAERQRAQIVDQGMEQHVLAEARAMLAAEAGGEASAREILGETLKNVPFKANMEQPKKTNTVSEKPVLGLVGGVTVCQSKQAKEFESNAVSLASEMSRVDF